jgi:hypothetical protein
MTMRRALGDVLLSACALSMLVAILMAFDGRVREQVRMRIDRPARASSDIAAVGTQLRDLFDVLLESAKTQSQQHGPLMILVAGGTVLMIFMLRV